MSNFKTYLQALVDAVLGKTVQKTETGFIAKQALPLVNTVYINLQNADWTYIPTENGYLSLDVFSANAVFLQGSVFSYSQAGARNAVFIPVIKGQNVIVGSTNFSGSSTLQFHPLVGGGDS